MCWLFHVKSLNLTKVITDWQQNGPKRRGRLYRRCVDGGSGRTQGNGSYVLEKRMVGEKD